MKHNRLEVRRDGEFCYDIVVTGSFAELGDELKQVEQRDGKPFGRICVVTDSHVAPLYLEQVMHELSACYGEEKISSYVFPAGEAHKQLDEVQKLYQHLIEGRFDRNSLLVALGGGVVGDMTGFAAATFLRGIRFIQVPTTLLAQVDSSIGGKTGVDFSSYKNMVGAFHMPSLVYMDLLVLRTLPREQISAGMGEVIKYGLIWERSFFDWLLDQADAVFSLDQEVLSKLVLESCKAKRAVVEEDPTEQGIRAILNFGHTIGHAMEKLSDFRLLHGACVAIGSVCAAYGSMKRGYLEPEEYGRICTVMQRYELPIKAEGVSFSAEDVLLATKSDKKMANGKIRFVFLEGIGTALIQRDVSDAELLEMVSQGL